MFQPKKPVDVVFMMVVIAVVICLCILGIATLFYWPPSDKTLARIAPGSSTEWANWVQAIGSIAAIVFSYRLGATQVTQARDERRRMEIAEAREHAVRVAEVHLAYQDARSTTLLLATASGKVVANLWHTVLEGQFASSLRKLENVATDKFTAPQVTQLHRVASFVRAIYGEAIRHFGPEYSAKDTPEVQSRTADFQGVLQRQMASLNEAYRAFQE